MYCVRYKYKRRRYMRCADGGLAVTWEMPSVAIWGHVVSCVARDAESRPHDISIRRQLLLARTRVALSLWLWLSRALPLVPLCCGLGRTVHCLELESGLRGKSEAGDGETLAPGQARRISWVPSRRMQGGESRPNLYQKTCRWNAPPRPPPAAGARRAPAGGR